jgi:hypothetical protein
MVVCAIAAVVRTEAIAVVNISFFITFPFLLLVIYYLILIFQIMDDLYNFYFDIFTKIVNNVL